MRTSSVRERTAFVRSFVRSLFFCFVVSQRSFVVSFAVRERFSQKQIRIPIFHTVQFYSILTHHTHTHIHPHTPQHLLKKFRKVFGCKMTFRDLEPLYSVQLLDLVVGFAGFAGFVDLWICGIWEGGDYAIVYAIAHHLQLSLAARCSLLYHKLSAIISCGGWLVGWCARAKNTKTQTTNEQRRIPRIPRIPNPKSHKTNNGHRRTQTDTSARTFCPFSNISLHSHWLC